MNTFLLDLKSVEIVLIWSVVPCIIISYALDESPRWLLSKGQEIPAKKIIQTMIKMNGQPLENLSKVQKQQKTVQKGTLGDILKHRGMCRNQLLLCVYWLGTSMGAYGLIFYTPTFDWNVYLVFVFQFIFIFYSIYNSLLSFILKYNYFIINFVSFLSGLFLSISFFMIDVYHISRKIDKIGKCRIRQESQFIIAY